jgi:GNAT superfamily N-acetyltransferase
VTNDLKIARAVARDVPAIVPLLSAQLEEHRMPVSREILDAAVRGIVTRPERGAILVAREEDRVVGIAVLPYTWTVEHGGLCAWLDELYVLPELRGRGVGTRLLRDALDLVRAEGCVAMDLEVDADHARVEGLYARHGFRALARRRYSRRLRP